MEPQKYPKISIWVAARNEEQNIQNCLSHLANQDYPTDKLQILIGNDASNDSTQQIIQSFIADKPNFELINVEKTINKQRGKANVLANLYEYSTGDVFLIVDADMKVPATWASNMVQYFIKNPNLGHLVGVSSVSSPVWYGYLQALDWLWALTLLKIASFFKIPLTGLGNNSAVRRTAYEATGGYDTIPFSITEDFALFHEVVNKKFDFFNGFKQSIYGKTTAMSNLSSFLHQRKRWMVGALQCPWWVVFCLYIQALFPFLLLGLWFFLGKELALNILMIKYILQILLLCPALFILKEYKLLPWLLIYEPYAWLWGFTMVIFYFLPININWKDRIYQ